jgi:GTP pyrophosphokinase
MEKAGIKAEVTGRPKHIYSIWRKMQQKHLGFEQIFDVRAVRILVMEEKDCYAALGVVHGLWRHISREFDDYIANPKENSYRSLHTAVIGPGGRALEVQIRTHEMHQHAELGVAAHWRYKEGGHFDQGFEEKIAWLRQLLEWKEEEYTAADFVDRFKTEAFQERIYALTPAGKIIDLPKGATPLDFAYAIHSEVGHRCRGAKVNGKIVTLTYTLKNADQVEILTAREGAPSRDWLNPHSGHLKSSRAKSRVRSWFRHRDAKQNASDGRAILDREMHRLGINNLSIEKLSEHLNFSTVDDLFIAIGRGDITTGQLANKLNRFIHHDQLQLAVPVHRRAQRDKDSGKGFNISGVGNLLTSTAQCCHPVPNDPIVGYITRGRGVTIHRRDCSNVEHLREEELDRLIDVDWGKESDDTWLAEIFVLAYDRPGLLRDVTGLLANEKINLQGVNTSSDKSDGMARMNLMLEISDIEQLSRVLTQIGQLSNVVEARRKA